MSTVLDFSDYARPPVINAASGFALGTALLAAVPKNATPEVTRSAKALRKATIGLQDEWIKHSKSGPAADARPFDIALDNAWSALLERLEAYSWLPSDQYPDAVRAADLSKILFPTRLSFVKLPYSEEWAESGTRIRRIDEENLAKDIDRIAGKEFLAEVRRTHIAYGQAIGTTRSMGASAEVSMAEPVRKLQEAIARYSIKAMAMLESDDEASILAVRAALAPIDAHRAGMARRSGDSAEPTVDPTQPVPDVKDTPQ